MKEYKVEPDATRITIGCVSLLNFVSGAGFCDLAMPSGSPSWAADAMIWCLIIYFVTFLLWRLMRIQDDNIQSF